MELNQILCLIKNKKKTNELKATTYYYNQKGKKKLNEFINNVEHIVNRKLNYRMK